MSTSRTLLDAIRDDNLEEVKRHLKKNPSDVNAKDHDGNTPLHLAAKNKNKEAITLLIQYGADVNAKNKRGRTPDKVSMLKGYNEIRELINRKAKMYNAIEDVRGKVVPEYDEGTELLNDLQQLDNDIGAAIEKSKEAQESKKTDNIDPQPAKEIPKDKEEKSDEKAKIDDESLQADLKRYDKIYQELDQKEKLTADELAKVFNYFLLFKDMVGVIGVHNPETSAGKKADVLRDKMKKLLDDKMDNFNKEKIPKQGEHAKHRISDTYIKFLVEEYNTSGKSSYYAKIIQSVIERIKYPYYDSWKELPNHRINAFIQSHNDALTAIEQSNNIEILGFDFDGTLTKTSGNETTNNELYKKVFNHLDKKTSDQILEEITGIDDKDDFFKMPDEAVEYLRRKLRDEDCKVVIISKNYKEYIEAILKHNGCSPEELDALKIIDANDLLNMEEGSKYTAIKNFIESLPENGIDSVISVRLYDDTQKDLGDLEKGAKAAMKGREVVVDALNAKPGKFSFEAALHLKAIKKLVEMLPRGSGAKKEYEKILKDDNLDDNQKITKISSAAYKRYQVNYKIYSFSRFFRKETSISLKINDALSRMTAKSSYKNSEFETKAKAIFDKAKNRKEQPQSMELNDPDSKRLKKN